MNFLNNDYLNKQNDALTYGLKETARSFISNSKYYLGGHNVDWQLATLYGSTEDIYIWERGNVVYGENPISWIGKIAILYPSDIYMTYSNGVNDVCYNSPYECHSDNYETGLPTKSWIYNSNFRDNEFEIKPMHLLSPYPGSEVTVFNEDQSGHLRVYNGAVTDYNYSIRPVVYLEPSINIISGEGTEQNPYVLG